MVKERCERDHVMHLCGALPRFSLLCGGMLKQTCHEVALLCIKTEANGKISKLNCGKAPHVVRDKAVGERDFRGVKCSVVFTD